MRENTELTNLKASDVLGITVLLKANLVFT
jgi:hypothetical protein